MMLGHLRFVLAIMVVVGHLGGWAGGVNVGPSATFAVFGFYVISGYLMTRVLHESYHFRLYEFAANRFLRLYPVYYAVAAVSFAILVSSNSPQNFHMVWNVNYRPESWVCILMIFPISFIDTKFLIVPPTWSVGVEIVNYFLLWAFVGRNWKFAALAFATSAVFHIISLVLHQSWGARYYPFWAAALPFSIGAGIYFIREIIERVPYRGALVGAVVASVLWVANICLGRYGSLPLDAAIYVNLATLTAMVVFMSHSQAGKLFKRSGKWTGDLAYLVFLTHWISGFVVWRLFFSDQKFGEF
jgi:peptidoglycan/LPS O-acetylase OafA/YrhL